MIAQSKIKLLLLFYCYYYALELIPTSQARAVCHAKQAIADPYAKCGS